MNAANREHDMREHDMREHEAGEHERREHEIAVVGMSCRLPGARDTSEYWRNLCAGVESITFFSDEQLAAAGVTPDQLNDPAFVRAYGALPDAYAFDAAFFGFTPREAQVTDPQHRVFLECAWSALEDAGYDPARVSGQIGVFAGSGSTPHLARVLAHPELVASVGQEVVLLANFKDFLTLRTSYRLGLRGPSVVVQTACSTSLVAIHVACQSLLNFESDLALAGGVGIAPDQVQGYRFQEGGIRAPDGHCRTFDARAAGTIFGSGAGVVVLKRLSEAVRDGDTIHAVVKGSAINNDGAGKIGFTAPSIAGQAAAIADALGLAGVDPATVSFVEAHGTGTPLGDPVEVAALTDVFRASTDRTGICALGAVKTNIGHLDCAAGVAGFIKTVLVLKHGLVPPTLHFERPNPELCLDRSPFYVNTTLMPLQRNGTPLRAGVSSLGMGGTNAHAVLEEAPELPPLPRDDRAQLVILSAATEQALQRMQRNLSDHLAAQRDLALADVAATLQDGRAEQPLRWAAAARTTADVRVAIEAALARPAAARAAERQRPIAFLFPGQGAQYAGMARALYEREPVFRRELDRCADAMGPALSPDLCTVAFSDGSPDGAAVAAADALLQQTRYTQPALFAVEYALAKLWMSWGVQPDAMIGHSLGEYVAACLAGVFSVEAAARLVLARGRLMQEQPAGAMLAVPLAEAETRTLLTPVPALSLASVNSPVHCVVSGSHADIDRLEAQLAARGVIARRVHTSHAFHSASMDPILDAFAAEVRRARPAEAARPFLSNVTGDWITSEQCTDADYWVQHLRHTVRFGDGLERLLADPRRVLLEVGPGETLSTFARRQAAGDVNRVIVRSLPSATEAIASDLTMLDAAGALWTAGVPLTWTALRGDAPWRRIPLPTYPFDRIEYRVPRAVTSRMAEMPVTAPLTQTETPTRAETPPQTRPPTQTERRSQTEPSRTEPASTETLPRTEPLSEAASRQALDESRGSRIADRVTSIFVQLLGIDASRLDPRRTFLELGADSLLLMQAGRTLEGVFRVRVPFRRLMEGLSTIDRLSAWLAEESTVDLEPAVAATAASSNRGTEPAPTPATEPVARPMPAAAAAAGAPVVSAVVPAGAPAVAFGSPTLPNVASPVAVPVGDGGPLHALVAQQLVLMQAQLDLLRGAAAGSSPSVQPPSLHPGIPSLAASPLAESPLAAWPPAASSPAVMPQTARSPAAMTVSPEPLPLTSSTASSAHGPHRPVRESIDEGGGLSPRQADHLDELTRAYTTQTRRSKAYAMAHRRVLADNRASLHFRSATKELLYPLVADRSDGARIWDVDGNEYIDVTLGFGVHFFGHRPAFIMEAIENQLRRGFHLGPQSDLAGPVAALFRELTGMERVTFCNTGSEAVMTALRIARTVTGRQRVAMFQGSYHGCFDGVLAHGRSADGREWHTRPVSPGTPPGMVEDVVVLPYGTPEALEWLRAHAADLAAVLVEPIQMRNPELRPAEFLRELRSLTARTGTTLIFDEMITGLRLQPTGAQGLFGIEADLATYGKVIGGGFPIGVVAGRASWMDAIDGGFWTYGDDSYPMATQTFFAGTFCKHPVTMAAAGAVLKHLQTRGPALYDDLNARTGRLVSALRAVIAETRAPMSVAHCGSVFRFRAESRDLFGDLLFHHMLQRGVYVWEGRTCFLSTAHTDRDCDLIVSAFRDSIRALGAGGFLPGFTSDDAVEDVPVAVAAASSVAQMAAPRSFPTTPAQRQIWIHAQLGDDASRAYNEQRVFALHGPFDAEAMRAAVRDVIAHHEALRTVFDETGDVQLVQPTISSQFETGVFEMGPFDMSGVVSDAEALQHALAGVARRIFDLSTGPLLHVHVHPRGPADHVVQIVVHHIVCDALGMNLLVRDLESAYDARRRGQAPVLPAAMQFSEYAALLRAHADALVGQEAAWLARFEGVTPLALPTDRPRPLLPSNQASTTRLRLPGTLLSRLKDDSRRHGRTLLMTMLGGWAMVLHRVADQADLVVGISSANRSFPGADAMIGHCVDLTPIRSRLEPGAGVRAFLDEVRASMLHAYEHDVFSYAHLSKLAAAARGPGIAPLVSVTFNVEPRPTTADGARPRTFAGLDMAPVSKPDGFAKFDIVIDAADLGDEMLIECRYNAALFDRTTIDRLLGFLTRALDQIASGTDIPVAELSLLDPAERVEVVEEWNRTAAPYPADRCIHELFEAQRDRTPDAIAVTCGDGALTYASLDARANQLAHHLRAMGIGPERRVGIRLERSFDLMIALLGVMKSGGAYVPLDPAFPSERCAYMLRDAGASVLLTQATLPDLRAAAPDITVLCVEDLAASLASRPSYKPIADVTAENLAYVIYTSGSTGQPKGVAMHHRGVSNYIDWGVRAYGAAEGHGSPVFTSMAVDLTITNLLALFAGRAVHLLPEANPVEALAQVLHERPGFGPIKITPLHVSLLTPFLAIEDARAATHTLVIGADFLSAEPTVFWQDHVPHVRLMNEYGPTETVVGCSAHTLPPGRYRHGAVPVGGPIQNLTFYVLDARLQPVPIGLPGELFIGGTGVARGYLGKPAVSADKFIPDPFAEPGARFYRTGDRARWLPGGNLLILGRSDHQVKVRGYRVELGEIEAVLRQHAAVTQCLVMVREDRPGDRQLVAYVVGQTDAATLRQHLHRTLPEYMVPAAFVMLDALPETATGKLDRKLLPAPDYARPEEEYVAPRTAAETTLTAIWSEVLRVDRVGVEDNFFALGGDSILAIQMVSRARRAGLPLTPRQLFEYQTIAALAATIDGPAIFTAIPAPAPAARPEGSIPLTPIQAWLLEHDLARPAHYTQSTLWDVAATVTNTALEAAWQAVIAHHDALRLRFRRGADGWRQWHAEHAGITLEHVDLAPLPEEERDRVQADITDQRQGSLDLEHGPLGRAVLFDRGAGDRTLLVILHHLVVDSVSWRALRDDLERACEQIAIGTPIDFGVKSASFGEWAAALTTFAARDDVAAELEYWTSQARLPLPIDGERHSLEADSRTITVHLDEAETRALLEAPAIAQTPFDGVLLHALAETLGAWAHAPQVAVMLEGHGREDAIAPELDLTRTVGWFTTIYPVMLDVPTGSRRESLDRITARLRSIPRKGLGYGLLRFLSPNAEARRALEAPGEPDISFNYLGRIDAGIAPHARFRLARGPRGRRSAAVNQRTTLLEVNCGINGGRLYVSWIYGERTHRRDTIERVAAGFLASLRGLIAAGPIEQDSIAQGSLAQAGIALAIGDEYPLTPMQEGMLFHAVSSDGPQAYQVQITQRLEGPLDVALFRRVWDEVVRRHAVLRTTFVWQGVRRPLQRVHPAVEMPWLIEDWRHRSASEQEAAADRYLADDHARGFALDRGPLLRGALFRVADQAYRFVWSVHHLLLDGWSVARLLAEVAQLYRIRSAGDVTPLPPAPPWRAYVDWLQQQDPHAAEQYWRRALAGFTTPTPLGLAAPMNTGAPRYVKVRGSLPQEQTRQLDRLARQTRVTLNVVVLGAWALLLSRYSGEEDVVFGTTTSGRPAVLDGVEDMIGMFINALPMRVSVPGQARLGAWLSALQQTLLDNREHEHAPLAQVQAWSEVPRGTPLFETHVVFENQPQMRVPSGMSSGTLPESAVRMTGSGYVEWVSVPLWLVASPGERLRLRLSSDEQRFASAASERMLSHLIRLLTRMAEQPDCRLSDLALLDDRAPTPAADPWNQTDTPCPADCCIHDLVEAQAARTPDAIAVIGQDETVSYAALNARANQLAHVLRRRGVGPEVRVAIWLPRSPSLVVAMLAVSKAGGAFLLLDASHPIERLTFMLMDADARVLVTDDGMRDALPLSADASAGITVVSIDAIADELAAASRNNPVGVAHPASLAYVIYTSGSTGQPKGVCALHSGLVNRVVAQDRLSPFTTADVCCLKAAVGFVDAVFETFGPLARGCPLAVASDADMRDGRALLALIARERVTQLVTVPTLARALVQLPDASRQLATVRQWTLGGELFGVDLLVRLQETLPSCTFLNLWGMTEVAADTTTYTCGRETSGPARFSAVPIGQPLANMQVHVLDESMDAVPLEITGELFVGGAGLARGYLRRPGFTAERFVPNPFGAAGTRLYRTGDLGRRRVDGQLLYGGRRDQQVKLRGMRLELGEIDAALAAHPLVRQTRVVVRDDASGDPRLVAYVVGQAKADTANPNAAADALRTHARRLLPEYMVPSTFVFLDEMPLTATGKIDVRALPAPEAVALADAYVAPRGPVEQALAAIWSDVLAVPRVGATDDFFALGGHSLKVMVLANRVKATFGVDLPMRTVFDAPTLGSLAAEIERAIYDGVLAMSETEAERLSSTTLPSTALSPATLSATPSSAIDSPASH